MATAQPPTSFLHTEVWVPFAQELEERTNGRVKVTLYHSGSLLSLTDTFDGVISGVADIGYAVPGKSPGRFPLISVTALPFMGPSSAVATRISTEVFEKFPEIRAEFADWHVLWFWNTEPFQISTTEKTGPVRTLEDLKGLKIGGGPAIIPPLKALGAAPLKSGIKDRYLSLQTGVLDGTCMGLGGISGWSLHEVAKYHTECGLLAPPNVTVMNLKSWNKLPADIQKIITELSAEAQQWQIDGANKEDKKARGMISEVGGEFIKLSPEEMDRWIEKATPIWYSWAMDMAAKGLPGREVLDEASQLMKKYRQRETLKR